MEDQKEILGKLIGDAIKTRGLSVRQAADVTGVSFSHLAKIVKGDVGVPTPKVLDKMAKGLGISYGSVFYAAGEFTGEKDNRVKEELSRMFTKINDNLVKFSVSFFDVVKSILSSYDARIPYPMAVGTSEQAKAFIFKQTMGCAPGEKQEVRLGDLVEELLNEEPGTIINILFIARSQHHSGINDDNLDEILFLLDLIPMKFHSANYAPSFAKKIGVLQRALVGTIDDLFTISHEAEEEDDLSWYENRFIAEFPRTFFSILRSVIDEDSPDELSQCIANDSHLQLDLQYHVAQSKDSTRITLEIPSSITNDFMLEFLRMLEKIQKKTGGG